MGFVNKRINAFWCTKSLKVVLLDYLDLSTWLFDLEEDLDLPFLELLLHSFSDFDQLLALKLEDVQQQVFAVFDGSLAEVWLSHLLFDGQGREDASDVGQKSK